MTAGPGQLGPGARGLAFRFIDAWAEDLSAERIGDAIAID
jgi:hypothetical protein